MNFQEYIKNSLYFTDVKTGILIDKRSLIKPLYLDKRNFEKWIHLFPKEERIYATELFQSLHYIDWDRFQEGLLLSFQKFIDEIGNREYYQYISNTRSSINFMTSICYSSFNMDAKKYGNDLLNHSGVYYTDVCYIDDCVYSGSQIGSMLNYIVSNVDSYRKSDIKINETDIKYYVNSKYDSSFIKFLFDRDSGKNHENSKASCLTGYDEKEYILIFENNSCICFDTIDDLIDNIHKYNIDEFDFRFKSQSRERYIQTHYNKREFNLHLVIPYIYREGYDLIYNFKKNNKRINICMYHMFIIEIPIYEHDYTKRLHELYSIVPVMSPDHSLIEEFINESVTLDYFTFKEQKVKLISPIVLQHKIASPVSSIFSSMISTGLVVSPMLLNIGIITNCGPLLNVINNNTESYILGLRNYCFNEENENTYDEEINISIKPVYKMKDQFDFS